eukprot:501716_1
MTEIQTTEECWKCNKPLASDQQFKCSKNTCQYIFCGRHHLGCAHECANSENNQEKTDTEIDYDTTIDTDLSTYLWKCKNDYIDIQIEAVQEIANLLAEDQISKTQIMKSQITPYLLNILSITTDMDINLDITYILCELLTHLPAIDQLISEGLIKLFLDLLCNNSCSSS